MYGYIEAQRAKLEENDIIESSVAKRIRRNPQIVSFSPLAAKLPDRPKAPPKVTLLQQHEIKVFSDKYDAHRASLLNQQNSDVQQYQKERDALADPRREFVGFDEAFGKIKAKYELDLENGIPIATAEDLNSLYAPYSSVLQNEGESNAVQRQRGREMEKVRVKRKYVLSTVASHINMDEIFSAEEVYGKYLDLATFYKQYQQHFKPTSTYVEYLHEFLQFPYNVNNSKSREYTRYLEQMVEYLEGFIVRTRPLENTDWSQVYKSPATNEQEGTSEGEVYCKACNKTFAKASVYQGHLSGKKHKKNAARMQSGDQTGNQTAANAHSGVNRTAAASNKHREHQIRQLGAYLKKTVDATIANAERKYAMTDRERLIESRDAGGDESEYTTVHSETDESGSATESSDDEYETSNLPLGADGKPIPFWLYKLQGLHKSYTCEICGNISYKGRMAFAKHFGVAKHQYGLKCLGISDDAMPLFKNITSIDEALELWKKIKRDKRAREGEVENAIEVEDDEGNVMTEKDYLDLKKQGLL